MKTPFAAKLATLTERRGSTATLSRTSGVPSANISRIASGDYIPSPEIVNALMSALPHDDAADLAVEYMMLHRPPLADMIQVVRGKSRHQMDRLELACSELDPTTREALANIIEAVNRSPEKGRAMLQSMGRWYQQFAGGAGLNEDPGLPKPSPVQAAVDYKAALKADKKQRGEGK